MTEAASNPPDRASCFDLSGRQLGGYQLLRRLGRGATADVYLAQQDSLRRQVAIKVLQSHLANDSIYVQRLHNEAMAAAALVHANIVQIYEVGQVEGVHFIAQEYVPGENLGEWIRRNGPADGKLAMTVMRQVAAALMKASEHAIVHRDIKPENIMLARSGELKVADFGLARFPAGEGVQLTQMGVTMGTPLYMSPEQIEGRPLDSRSDIYSFGVTCYHLLFGRPPFEGDTALSVAMQHLNATAKPLQSLRPDLPERLCQVVHKMIEKIPDKRHDDPRQLLQDLHPLGGVDEDTTGVAELWGSTGEIVGTPSRVAATGRLDELMKTSAKLATQRPKLAWLAVGIVGSVLLGVAVAAISRPKSLLDGAAHVAIPKRETVWGQLYHAKLTDTERAWQAVGEHFPEDEYAKNLARQGLVRYYMEHSKYDQALQVLDELANLGDTEIKFRAFGLAGKSIIMNQLGKSKEAMAAFDQITPEMTGRLDRSMQRKLITTVSKHRAEMRGQATQVFQRLKEDAGP